MPRRRAVLWTGLQVSLAGLAVLTQLGAAAGQGALPPALSVSGVSPSAVAPVNLTAPYHGFKTNTRSSTYVTPCSPGSGGGWGRARPVGRWDEGRGIIQSAINVTTSSACWLNSTHGSYLNQSEAEIWTVMTITLPVRFPTGSTTVDVGLNGIVSARESFSRTGSCSYNATWIALGVQCEDISSYLIWIGAAVEDVSSHVEYCQNSSAGVCLPDWSLDEYRQAIYPCAANCTSGADSSVQAKFNATETVTMNTNSSHRYELVIWLRSQVYVYVAGWPGRAAASVNIGKPGFGVRVDYFDLQ